MQLTNKHKVMLLVLIGLLIIRFVLFPIFEWQEKQISLIATKEQKLIKTNNIINRLPQITESLAQLKQSNNNLQTHYFNEKSLNAFKLQQQQRIETLFSQHQLKVTNFNWVVEVPGDEITQIRAKVSFQGKAKNFAMLQLTIAQLPELLNLLQWDLYIKRMSDNSLGDAHGAIYLTTYNIVKTPEAM